MPTETDPTPPPQAQDIDSTATLHTSCPPEEQIQSHAPREERIDGPMPDASPGASGIVDDGHEISRAPQRTAEEDARGGAEEDPSRREKIDNVEDGPEAEFSSPIGSPEASSDSSDGKLARSMGAAVLDRGRRSPRTRPIVREESLDGPRYLSYPPHPGRQKVRIFSIYCMRPRGCDVCWRLIDLRKQLSSNSTTSFLHPGSKFRGTQQSDRQVYDVQVEIKDVDLAESFLCGYLKIQGKRHTVLSKTKSF